MPSRQANTPRLSPWPKKNEHMRMIDAERLPTAPRPKLSFAEVELESRYSKRHDLEVMMLALDALGNCYPHILIDLRSVFCDTKACSLYSVECRSLCPQLVADCLG